MARARGLILDRDGVINVDVGFLHRTEDCVFVDGIVGLLQAFQAAGFRLIVATNQSGIGRGLFDEAAFRDFMDWMKAELRGAGIVIDAVYHCPDHPTEGIGRYRRENSWRKPGPGMFLQAIADFDLDPASSWAIGDRERDIAAAAAAGIGHRVLYESGGIERVRADGVQVAATLGAVATLLAGSASGS
jgi:D-glycero-D-manno-heptose 1,7-bisphosphate phosphatase